MKYCILVALFLLGTLADDILVQSDTSATIVVGQAQDTSIVVPKSLVPDTAAVDTSYLASDSLGDGSKWTYPVDTDNNPKILPIGWFVTYQSNIYTDCPQNSATLYIGSSSYFTVYLNGVVIGTGNGWATIYKFLIKLNCGCNNLTIIALNRIRSPAGVIYSVKQDKTGCYDCKNLGITFYNRDTCKCECVNNCGCSYSQTWYDYPNCFCKCAAPVDCVKPKFYNFQTCQCECNKICCPANYYQDPSSCRCVRRYCSPPFVPCPDGTYWDPYKCACIKNCIQTVLCIRGFIFNHSTCKCEPGKIIGMIPLNLDVNLDVAVP